MRPSRVLPPVEFLARRQAEEGGELAPAGGQAPASWMVATIAEAVDPGHDAGNGHQPCMRIDAMRSAYFSGFASRGRAGSGRGVARDLAAIARRPWRGVAAHSLDPGALSSPKRGVLGANKPVPDKPTYARVFVRNVRPGQKRTKADKCPGCPLQYQTFSHN